MLMLMFMSLWCVVDDAVVMVVVVDVNFDVLDEFVDFVVAAIVFYCYCFWCKFCW